MRPAWTFSTTALGLVVSMLSTRTGSVVNSFTLPQSTCKAAIALHLWKPISVSYSFEWHTLRAADSEGVTSDQNQGAPPTMGRLGWMSGVRRRFSIARHKRKGGTVLAIIMASFFWFKGPNDFAEFRIHDNTGRSTVHTQARGGTQAIAPERQQRARIVTGSGIVLMATAAGAMSLRRRGKVSNDDRNDERPEQSDSVEETPANGKTGQKIAGNVLGGIQQPHKIAFTTTENGVESKKPTVTAKENGGSSSLDKKSVDSKNPKSKIKVVSLKPTGQPESETEREPSQQGPAAGAVMTKERQPVTAISAPVPMPAARVASVAVPVNGKAAPGSPKAVLPKYMPPLNNEKYMKARQQPKPAAEEAALAAKYAAIESLEERAYQILLDLGMLESH